MSPRSLSLSEHGMQGLCTLGPHSLAGRTMQPPTLQTQTLPTRPSPQPAAPHSLISAPSTLTPIQASIQWLRCTKPPHTVEPATEYCSLCLECSSSSSSNGLLN